MPYLTTNSFTTMEMLTVMLLLFSPQISYVLCTSVILQPLSKQNLKERITCTEWSFAAWPETSGASVSTAIHVFLRNGTSTLALAQATSMCTSAARMCSVMKPLPSTKVLVPNLLTITITYRSVTPYVKPSICNHNNYNWMNGSTK